MIIDEDVDEGVEGREEGDRLGEGSFDGDDDNLFRSTAPPSRNPFAKGLFAI